MSYSIKCWIKNEVKKYPLLWKVLCRLMDTAKYLIGLKWVGFIYFLYQKNIHPEIFRGQIQGGPTVVDTVKYFEYSIAVVNWFIDKGDDVAKVKYPLNQNSVVFDVGGYIGDWSDKIKKYNPYIYIFEPNPFSVKILQEKYKLDYKIKVFPFGLAEKNKFASLGICDIGSSVYVSGANQANVELRDIKQAVTELNIADIDLIKINIEGGEYNLLFRMIETGIIKQCNYILIQFHEWFKNAHLLRRKIRRSLSLSHRLSWDYPFVWESWERIKR